MGGGRERDRGEGLAFMDMTRGSHIPYALLPVTCIPAGLIEPQHKLRRAISSQSVMCQAKTVGIFFFKVKVLELLARKRNEPLGSNRSTGKGAEFYLGARRDIYVCFLLLSHVPFLTDPDAGKD